MNARRFALNALTAFRQRQAYMSLYADAAFRRSPMTPEDRRLATAIVSGVLRWRRWLDWQIGRISKIPIQKIEPAVLDALRIGLFQMARLDRIPAHAAVNESTRLVPHRAKGFAHAILRTLARCLDELPEPAGPSDVETLAIRTSHPDWIVRMWIEDYGFDRAEMLLQAMLEDPPAVLRAHGIERGELMELLRAADIDAEPTRWSRNGLRVRQLEKCLSSEAFAEGMFVVQGEASQIAGDLLDPRPGERVLDVCAAPGGKTTDAAARVERGGRVVALDLHAGRVELIRANVKRLKLNNVETYAIDAAAPFDVDDAPFDRVIVDAPCTGLGQLRKHPEAKWMFEPEDAPRLAKLQLAILENASVHLKPGGRLVYSTCTLTRPENVDVVAAFLQQNAEFEKIDAAAILPAVLAPLTTDGFLHCLPSEHGAEGFFAAVMERRKS